MHEIVANNNADLLARVLKSNPIAVFVRIGLVHVQDDIAQQNSKREHFVSSRTLLGTALHHDSSRCIPIILQYYLHFLNVPDSSGDKEEIHHVIHKKYFGLDMEKAGSDAHPFQLGESLVHPCEWIEIDDFHNLSMERKYASLYIEFVKSLHSTQVLLVISVCYIKIWNIGQNWQFLHPLIGCIKLGIICLSFRQCGRKPLAISLAVTKDFNLTFGRKRLHNF
jgi:hypothetical protein